MTTSGGGRDLDEIQKGLVAWCSEHRPDLAATGIAELSHPSAGMSNETIIVRCGPKPDGAPGARFVVRLPPVVASFPDLDFGLAVRVQEAVGAAGIPVAGPTSFEDDPRWLGAPFVVMPFVEGTIPGAASLFDPWLTEATEAQRRDAQREMVRVLTAVAHVDWHVPALEELLGNGTGSLDDQIDQWEHYLHWAGEGRSFPRIEAILAWCRKHAPPEEAGPSLVWGDPRLENLVFDDDRRACAVLDWELATIGPAEMDLGWYLGLERVLHQVLGMDPLAGFASPDEVVADLAVALGRPLQDPEWHQIFAVVRSVCINVRQADISARAGVEYMVPGGERNPLLAIAERWATEHPASH
ncbi:MAG: phosphotransferase family protein [Acidimicrobiales bacterium]